MENTSSLPAPWKKVGLALLPGLVALATSGALLTSIFHQSIPLPIAPVGLFAVGVLVMIAGLVRERRLAAWTLPALGIVGYLVSAWWWVPLVNSISRFVDAPGPFWNMAAHMLWLAAPGAIAGLAAYQVCREHSIHIPRLAWALLGLMILLAGAHVITSIVADANPYRWATLLERLWLSLWGMGLILAPIAIGLPLAWRNGTAAGLMVVAFQYLMLDGLVDCVMVNGRPTCGLCICTSDEMVGILLSWLPAVLFLLASPIWVLRSHPAGRRFWGLILPPLIAVVSGELIRALVCRGTPSESWIVWWLKHALSSAQYLLPVALAAVLYHEIERQVTAANTRTDVELQPAAL